MSRFIIVWKTDSRDFFLRALDNPNEFCWTNSMSGATLFTETTLNAILAHPATRSKDISLVEHVTISEGEF